MRRLHQCQHPGCVTELKPCKTVPLGKAARTQYLSFFFFLTTAYESTIISKCKDSMILKLVLIIHVFRIVMGIQMFEVNKILDKKRENDCLIINLKN